MPGLHTSIHIEDFLWTGEGEVSLIEKEKKKGVSSFYLERISIVFQKSGKTKTQSQFFARIAERLKCVEFLRLKNIS